MKYCPQCHKQYTENWITFCSDDGTILIDTGYPANQQTPTPGSQHPYSTPYQEPPTWRSPDPNAPGGWVSPDQSTPTPAPAWQPPRPPAVYPRSQQTNGLATASMILGIIGLFIGFCLGPLPGIAALILGLVAINQIKKAPQNGRPLAIVGVVTGSLSLLFYGMLFIFWIIGAILSH
ncbi:MAG TPA: DUF4190 domain-containing protein [Pyrinomonadaceae bacterium]|nr:DUF4190 domain-containing protein [Pyrinomonadaceae bacterium]